VFQTDRDIIFLYTQLYTKKHRLTQVYTHYTVIVAKINMKLVCMSRIADY